MQLQDNNHVHTLSTTHDIDEKITRSRKRPRITSTSGLLIRSVFGSNHTMNISIPALIDDYSYDKGGVDIADQYRSHFFTQLIARRNWLPFFFWLLDIILVNSFILHLLATANSISRTAVTHKDFRLLVGGQLLQKYGPEVGKKPRTRYSRWYYRKTTAVRYGKVYGIPDLPPPVRTVLLSDHVQVHLEERKECECCHIRLRREEVNGKRAPTSYFACRICTFVLCHSCFVEYHRPFRGEC